MTNQSSYQLFDGKTVYINLSKKNMEWLDYDRGNFNTETGALAIVKTTNDAGIYAHVFDRTTDYAAFVGGKPPTYTADGITPTGDDYADRLNYFSTLKFYPWSSVISVDSWSKE